MIRELIRKEFMIEFRQKATLGGVLVYIIGSVFISALCFKGRLDKPSWNALFWVITLFTSVTVAGRSFQRETGGTALFNYLHYSPRQYIVAKMAYQAGFMVILSVVTYFFYSFFIQDQVDNKPFFILILVLASAGMSGVLCLMSAIAARAGSGFALMSILSFPVIMPLFMVTIRLSRQAVDGIEWAGVDGVLLVVLVALNVLTATLSFLLFPYLWRE